MSRTPILKQLKGEGSFNTMFNKSVGDITETKWRDLLEEQDYDTLIYDIREDLITQVTDECYRKHIKREVYKFLVECTHEAFEQAIPLHFYTYDESHKHPPGLESWIPDDEPVICKPDSWAKGNIPYNADEIPKSKYQQTDGVFSAYTLIKCTEYPSTDVFDDATKYGKEPVHVDIETSCTDENDTDTQELEPVSQYTVQFISNNETTLSSVDVIPSIQDIAIQPHRSLSENMFYKIMKVNKSSILSLHQNSMKGKKFAMPPSPTWMSVDETKDELKQQTFNSSRYLQMRQECLATIDSTPPRTDDN